MGLSPRIETIEAGTLTNGIKGKTTGAAIPAGYVGQKITGTNLTPSIASSGTRYNISQIDLTAGVWLIIVSAGATASVSGSGAAPRTYLEIANNTSGSTVYATADVPTLPLSSGNVFLALNHYVNISSNTSYFVNVLCTFSGGTLVAGSSFAPYAVRIA